MTNNHRNSPALYQRIKSFIEKRIQEGQWLPGARIPSENELAEKFKASRMTVNRSLREMTAEGHLVRTQGLGTFVAKPKPLTSLLEVRSIDDEINSWGGVHSSDMHLLTAETVLPILATAMQLPEGASIFHAIVVHKDRGTPVLLADRFINPVCVPELLEQDFEKQTITRYLLDTVPLTKVEHVIEAVIPDQKTRNFLKISVNEPCLCLHRKTWNGDMVATHSTLTYPGSRYRIGGRFAPKTA